MSETTQGIVIGAQVKFGGTAPDVAFSFEGTANGAGRVSTQYDTGADPRADEYGWKCSVQSQATPVQGSVWEVWAAGAPDYDSTEVDGRVGVVDAALGDIDQTRNLKRLGSIRVEDADTTVMTGGGRFIWTQQYMSIVMVNKSGAAVDAAAANFSFHVWSIRQHGNTV